MKALAVLIVAAALCTGVLYGGPPIAEWLIARLPASAQQGPLADTVFTITLFGALVVFALIGGRIAGRSAARPGSRPGRMLVGGAALGAVGVLVTALYAWLAGGLGLAATTGTAGMLLWGAALVLVETVSEEMFFRGWLQPVLVASWGAVAGIVVAAIVFAGLHILGGTRDPVSIINLFLGGVLFGMLARHSGGIAGAAAAHFAWNVTETIVLGLTPNPGLGSFGALINYELVGPSLWGGSQEGLNASVAMTLTLVALLVALGLLMRGAPDGPGVAATPLGEPA